MRFAIVENNTVTNIAIASHPIEDNWIESEIAAIGDNYVNGQFIKVNYKNGEYEQKVKVRAERTRRLFESDWTQGKDIPDSVSSAWAVYRQALRDIPTQSGFPWEVNWPAQPE